MTYIILLIIVFVLLFIANKIVNKMFASVGMYSERGNRSYQYQLVVTTLDGKTTEMTFYSYHSGRTFDSILVGTKRVRMDNNYLSKTIMNIAGNAHISGVPGCRQVGLTTRLLLLRRALICEETMAC